jgi:hypothetical protein
LLATDGRFSEARFACNRLIRRQVMLGVRQTIKLMPEKPTRTFGRIAFGKDGKVRPLFSVLPSVKEQQERAAMDLFVDGFNECHAPRQITNVQQLPENDHDFLVKVNGRDTLIQLTELVDRSFTFAPADPAFGQCSGSTFMQREPAGPLWRIDETKRDLALTRLIEQKVSKGYAVQQARPLWLVIFTTAFYSLEHRRDGELVIAKSLTLAREYLNGLKSPAFDEVWCTDLQTRPIAVSGPSQSV